MKVSLSRFAALAVLVAGLLVSANLTAQVAAGPAISADTVWTVFDFKSTADWKTTYADLAPLALVQDAAAGTITLNIPAKRDIELGVFSAKASGKTVDLSKVTTFSFTIVNAKKIDLQYTVYGGFTDDKDYKPSSDKDKMVTKKGETKVSIKLATIGKDLSALRHLIVQIYNNGGTDVPGVIIKDAKFE